MHDVLHTVRVSNWIPTKNKQSVTIPTERLLYVIGQKKKVNIGQLIFENLASLGGVKNPKFSIGNPSLLYELVMIQAPRVKLAIKCVARDLQKFNADHKLFFGKHSADAKSTGSNKLNAKVEYDSLSTIYS